MQLHVVVMSNQYHTMATFHLHHFLQCFRAPTISRLGLGTPAYDHNVTKVTEVLSEQIVQWYMVLISINFAACDL